MIYGFTLRNHRLDQLNIEADATTLNQAIWIDLLKPDDAEREQVESMYRQNLPEPEEVEEIEASARFFEDADGLHLHSYFLHRQDKRISNSTVAFTLKDQRLFTLHDYELPAFRMFRLRARREQGLANDALSLMVTLFETKVEELADILEEVQTALNAVSTQVLESNEASMEDAIDELARQEDINGKVRLCLMDTQRALTYLLRRARLGSAQADEVREILRDVESLLPHNSFLFEKVNFLMDAAQGFISIEQNKIIKIFSIAAVVFLPPTMIASIYGMNFQLMPELSWEFGYPLAIGLMVLSGIAPYWYFKYRGWL